jgi:hypothetical protein
MFILMLALFLSWTEDFEPQAYFPPNNWMIVNEDALDAVWYRADCQAHSGVKAAVCYYDTAYSGLSHTNLDYLITPRVLPSGSDTILGFWALSTTSAGCSLDIMISTASIPEMTSFTTLQTFVITSASWIQQNLSLGTYSGTPLYVCFRVRRIPLGHVIGIDDISLPDTTSQLTPCNGRMRTKGPPSQKYLQLWGTSYEMGFAHGYLIASGIMSMYLNKWIGYTSYHSVTPDYYEYTYLPLYRAKYYVPLDYQQEAQGIIDGMTAKGVSIYHPDLDRDLTAEDIWAISGAGDTVSSACSSISGWGDATSGDDTLQGGYIIARNVDGLTGLYTTLANTSLIIAYSPSNPQKQRFFNVSWAGVFGTFSCLNENGVGLCSNAGNHPDTNAIPPNSLLGHLLSSRQAVELVDPDGSGENDIFDIDSMKIPRKHLRAHEYHAYSPYDGAHPIPGAVIETNNLGDSLRFATHNYIAPQIYSLWNLVVTNHHRVLYPPVYCSRYARMADSLNADFHLSTQRAMTIINSVAVGYNHSTSGCTNHSVVIRPNIAVEHPNWPCVGVSYARRHRAAHTQGKVWYSWNELFDGVPSGVEEEAAQPVKHKKSIATIFAGAIRLPKNKECRVFNITGRQVDAAQLTPGVYFIEIDGKTMQKVVKIR